MFSNLNIRILLTSFIISAGLMLFLCFSFEPIWLTNDDLQMSMLAHGYGITAFGSANLPFSNILWGYFVRLIPEINGAVGYSIATLIVLVVTSTIVLYVLYKSGFSYFAFIILFAILSSSVLFPQYTINAGLLTTAAVSLLIFYERSKKRYLLIVSCILIFWGYLIRIEITLLILFIALPLFSWKALRSQFTKKVFLFLILFIGLATFINYKENSGKAWKFYHEFNLARLSIMSYGGAEPLRKSPEVLSKYGYSINDINLIGRWFWLDPDIANPKKITNMLLELEIKKVYGNFFNEGLNGIKTLMHPTLSILILIGILLLLRYPYHRVLFSWILFIFSCFFFDIFIYPFPLRVSLPIIYLLILAPLLLKKPTVQFKYSFINLIFSSIITCLMTYHVHDIFSHSKNMEKQAIQIRRELKELPSYPIALWGGAFPFRLAYPVLKLPLPAQFYFLGPTSLVPNSYNKEFGYDIKNLLARENGIPIIMRTSDMNLLKIYCKERLNTELKELSQQSYGSVVVRRLQCRKKT